MIRTPVLIQEKVPINKPLTTPVQIVNDVHGVTLTQLPITHDLRQRSASQLLAPLSEQQVFVGPQICNPAHVLEACAAPKFENSLLAVLTV
eukprot:CAMPEP_0115714148 /NCGR_PEP_ID=MMETSP0272-20121206/75070_1 /TAXON_ID=71861 /ORGANISM="Scrippsiella trochoidea, Strain CCMP3099" /LENGTH=90 /DNA_ID=CAMNT_0003156245 /DNA_START=250 /DNA_END=522 /DNA_ORIENTATION=+